MADRVEQVVRSGAMPVTIGGDHSMAAGSIAGLARARDVFGRIGVIWIDAHGDIHTPETSPSKAYHGMPLAALLGLGDKDFARIGGPLPVLRPENIVYLGLRSTEAAENRRISDLGIHAYSMKDIAGSDVKKVFAKALKAISKNIDCLVLSIDLDAFDPAAAPAVGSPEKGGFKREEVLAALDHLTNLRAPDMVEIVEFNPTLAGAEQTYGLLKDILSTILNTKTPFITTR
jgi:arginase